VAEADRAVATGWVRQALRNGQFRYYEADQAFPNHIWYRHDPGLERAPVNELRLAYRQAAGRAFAAEFLAPVNEVLSMWKAGRDTVAISEAFAVSTEVIERRIENTRRIEWTTL
jgi:hypothetical protein